MPKDLQLPRLIIHHYVQFQHHMYWLEKKYAKNAQQLLQFSPFRMIPVLDALKVNHMIEMLINVKIIMKLESIIKVNPHIRPL
jgi:hypothetical protein